MHVSVRSFPQQTVNSSRGDCSVPGSGRQRSSVHLDLPTPHLGEGGRGARVVQRLRACMGFGIRPLCVFQLIHFAGPPFSSFKKMATVKNYHLPQKGCGEDEVGGHLSLSEVSAQRGRPCRVVVGVMLSFAREETGTDPVSHSVGALGGRDAGE